MQEAAPAIQSCRQPQAALASVFFTVLHVCMLRVLKPCAMTLAIAMPREHAVKRTGRSPVPNNTTASTEFLLALQSRSMGLSFQGLRGDVNVGRRSLSQTGARAARAFALNIDR